MRETARRTKPASTGSDRLDEVKCRASIKLEAGLHQYFDPVAAADLSDDEALRLAKRTVQQIFRARRAELEPPA